MPPIFSESGTRAVRQWLVVGLARKPAKRAAAYELRADVVAQAEEVTRARIEDLGKVDRVLSPIELPQLIPRIPGVAQLTFQTPLHPPT